MNENEFHLQLVRELGVQDLTEPEQRKILSEFTVLVQNRLSEELVGQLNDEELQKFDEIADDDEKLLGYLQERFPNYQDLLDKSIQACKLELVEQSQRFKDYISTEAANQA